MKPDSDESDDHPQPERPAPYPLDLAMEAAYAPPPGTNLPAPPATDESWMDDGATATEQDGDSNRDGSGEAGAATGTAAAGTVATATALVTGDAAIASSPHARTPARDQPPETVAERLRGLPQWQARYVLALMECGGVMGLACLKVNVSRQSVEAALAKSADFARAAAEAVEHSTDLVEAAVMRGASIGDLAPVYQGGLLVGYKRVRNTKDAELALKLRGRLKEETTVRHVGKVEIVSNDRLGGVLAEVTARLFAARQGAVIDAETGKLLPSQT